VTDPLEARLQEVIVAAQRRWRTARGWGAITSIPIPDRFIDEIAAGLTPVLRELAREAAREVAAEQASGRRAS
jgi:hypothetical protein